MIESLEEFLERKINPIFEFEITPDEVIFRFDIIIRDTVQSAITIADNAELKYFHDLLNNRKIHLIGNIVEKGAECRAITINELAIS